MTRVLSAVAVPLSCLHTRAARDGKRRSASVAKMSARRPLHPIVTEWWPWWKPHPGHRSIRDTRKDKEDVMAPAGISRPSGECYGHQRHVSPSPFGPEVEAASREKCHYESKTDNYCPLRIDANGQWRKCTTQERQSDSRSASAIPIVGRPLRILFPGASVVSKSRSRALCEPELLFVVVAQLTNASYLG
jgi:hypothetical protein